MSRNKIYIWVSGIGLLLIALVVFQFFWLKEAAAAHKREQKMRALRALESTEQKMRNSNYCFNMYGKTYLDPGEQFYILRKKSGQAVADTTRLIYDTEGVFPDEPYYEDKVYTAEIPASVEIHLNYTIARPFQTNTFSKDRQAFEKDPEVKKLREIIANRHPVDSIFNMAQMDTLLRNSLAHEQLDTNFGFALVDAQTMGIAYARRVKDTIALLSSDINIPLFADNKFLKPYKLAVILPVSPVYANNWIWLSVCIIFVLMASFYAFARLYIRQNKLSEMKSDFINNLTHEFNTPMANIALAIETLQDNNPPQQAKLKRLLGIISSESGRLRENIDRALHVATMEKGEIQFHMEEIDLVVLINLLLNCYQLQCENLGGSIRFIHTNKALVRGDETHLLNCICNLLDNAIKYRRNAPVVEIFLEEQNNQLVLTVSDNGIGMDTATQKHVFEKFYRAHEGNVHSTRGFGLGLSYVKGVIEKHGGKISVKSRAGDGSRFIIQLPKLNVHDAGRKALSVAGRG